MTNPFYVASGTPATSSFGASQPMRSEFQAIQGGFEKFPDFTGSAPGTFLINNFTATGITTAPGMLIDPAGNIGIGIGADPLYLLNIAKNQNGATILLARNSNPGTAASIRLTLTNDTSPNGGVLTLLQLGANYTLDRFYRPSGAIVYASGAGGLTLDVGVPAPIYFNTNDTERMRIDATGYVGIGTPAPIRLLHVSAVAGSTGGLLRAESASDSVNPVLELRDATTAQARTNSVNFLNDAGAAIGAIAYGSRSSTIPNCMTFITNSVERMRIDSGGIVTIPGQLSANGPFTVGTVGIPGSIFFKRDSDGVIQSRIAESASNIGLYFETTSGGAFSFFTSGGAFGSNAERMRIDSNGYVGIGMAPSVTLDMTRNQNAPTVVRLTNNDTGSASRAVIQLANTVGVSNFQMNGQNYSSIPLDIQGGLSIVNAGNGMSLYNTGGYPMLFGTSNVERMRIDAAGNVGIGPPVALFPAAPLHVVGAGAANFFYATIVAQNGFDPKYGYYSQADGYQWSTRVATKNGPAINNGEWVLSYDSAALDCLIVDRSGRVGIYGLGGHDFDIYTGRNGAVQGVVANFNSTDGSSQALWGATNGGYSISMGMLGQAWASSGLHANNSAYLQTNALYLLIETTQSAPIIFGIGGIQRAQVSAGGFIKASDSGQYFYAVQDTHNFNSHTDTGYECVNIEHYSVSQPYGMMIRFPNVNPNDAQHYYWRCYSDSGAADLARLQSNGGLGNYATNNVNYSDARLKETPHPYGESEMADLEAAFLKVNWGKYKFLDQTHTDWNHGPTAQDIEDAFVNVAPELVDEIDVGARESPGNFRKVIYETDLTNISRALLAKVMKDVAMLKTYLPRA